MNKTIKVPESVKNRLEKKIQRVKRTGKFTSLKRELEQIIIKYHKLEL